MRVPNGGATSLFHLDEEQASRLLLQRFPWKLPEEAINTSMPVRCVVRLLKLLWHDDQMQPAVIRWIRFYHSNSNTDQGMYQLIFFLCSLLVSPDKNVLLDVYKRFEVHRLTRRQLLDTLKEVHQAFKRTS